MSNVRWALNEGLNSLHASQVIAANATTAFDFGTPNDIDLRDTPFEPGDRVLLLITATRAAGSTSTLTFTVQDAPDDGSGGIGTPGTAVTSGTVPSFATDSGAVHKAAMVTVKLQPDRPFLRVNAVHGVAGTDSFQCHCSVIGVPSNA